MYEQEKIIIQENGQRQPKKETSEKEWEEVQLI